MKISRFFVIGLVLFLVHPVFTATPPGNFGSCNDLPIGWNCGNTNGLFGSSSNITNGIFASVQVNPNVGNDNNYYYATTQKGVFPWSPCQAPVTGVISPAVVSIGTTFVPTLLPTMSPGMRYHIYIALYYWLPNGPIVSHGLTYRCLDTQVRVENIGGVFSPIGRNETYNPGDSFGWDMVELNSVSQDGMFALTANVQKQCQLDEQAWGFSAPCQLAGVEIGTEGFQFQELDVNWYSVDFSFPPTIFGGGGGGFSIRNL